MLHDSQILFVKPTFRKAQKASKKLSVSLK